MNAPFNPFRSRPPDQAPGLEASASTWHVRSAQPAEDTSLGAALIAPAAFFERAQQAAGVPASSFGLLLIDLHRFHAVNQTHGYAAGDELLDMVGRRLAARVRPEDCVTRVGGDEFALLLADMFDSASAVGAARSALGALDSAFTLRGMPQSVSACGGIALCPAHGRDIRALLHAARSALHAAKEIGIDVVVAQPRAQDSGVPAPRPMRNHGDVPSARELRDGLVRSEFRVHYQPIHNFNTRRVDTLEALVRWQHPTRGLLAPAAFLPVAERVGLSHVISVRVLDCACSSLQYWRSRGHSDLRMAVNLSAHDLRRDDFAGTVAATLDRHRLVPSALELELTEHEQLDDERAGAQADELARQGVTLTIDDFGVKYSSLRYLHRLPVRALKVDGSFVRDVGRSAASESIISAVVGIASKMGLRLVAEGVEEVRQMTELRRLGCHIMQGFLFSRPVPADDVIGYLDRTLPAT
jgi:diguanylate cyclase (GGDEF)-like protein